MVIMTRKSLQPQMGGGKQESGGGEGVTQGGGGAQAARTLPAPRIAPVSPAPDVSMVFWPAVLCPRSWLQSIALYECTTTYLFRECPSGLFEVWLCYK